MTYTQRQIKILVIKLIFGAIVFSLLDWMFKEPDMVFLSRGTCSAYIGYTILIVGESIWKIYKRKKIKENI